jgi:hypothetical protein
MQTGMLDASWFVEHVILIEFLTDQQVIKYAKHLSGQSNNTNFLYLFLPLFSRRTS